MKTNTARITTIVILAFALQLFAQEKKDEKPTYGWKNDATGIVNFTQNQFDNWAAGGENSWSWQADVNAKFANDQEKYNWTTSGKFSFGKTKVGDAGSRKAADEIKLESVYTFKMSLFANPFVAVSGLTQFTKGYKYEADTSYAVSEFMDPGYFTQSIGVGMIVNKNVKTRLGAALKETVTDKYPKLYGKGKTMRTEFGAESVTDAEFFVMDNIKYVSKLELFSNFKGLDETDVNWDNIFSAKVNSLITVSLNVRLMYDKDVSAKRQLKETLAVGLSYTFF